MSELYYTDSGETHLEALIMLHGNGENGEIFRSIIAADTASSCLIPEVTAEAPKETVISH